MLSPALLDLHEGIVHPDLTAGCTRWPEGAFLLNESTGELVRGRCKATNLCLYCARLFAVETSEMLLLDAMEEPPVLYSVLTAREHLVKADCRKHLYQLRLGLRRRWPSLRWAVTTEFQRRGALHLNLITKGVPADALAEYHADLSARWCSRVDALPVAQWSDVIADGVGVVQYISLHFQKSSQAPALGWRGHRFSASRDYFVRSAAVMRREARESLNVKRRLWRVLSENPDAAAEFVEAEVARLGAEAASAAWKYVDTSGGGPDLDRVRRDAARAPLRRVAA